METEEALESLSRRIDDSRTRVSHDYNLRPYFSHFYPIFLFLSLCRSFSLSFLYFRDAPHSEAMIALVKEQTVPTILDSGRHLAQSSNSEMFRGRWPR